MKEYLCLNHKARSMRLVIDDVLVRTCSSYKMGVKLAMDLLLPGQTAYIHHKNEAIEDSIQIERIEE